MLWKSNNVEARIWPNDHCPPHVTFINRPDGWTARVEFSMVNATIALKDIKPVQTIPKKSEIQNLLDQVAQNLRMCRDQWWDAQKTLCLDNKDVVRVKKGEVKLGSVGAVVGKVVAKSGKWEKRKATVSVKWGAGQVTTEVCKG